MSDVEGDGHDPFDEVEDPFYDDEDDLQPGRRPIWVAVVAAIVLVGLVIGAVPRFLWPWIILVGFIVFMLWRSVGPRRTD